MIDRARFALAENAKTLAVHELSVKQDSRFTHFHETKERPFTIFERI